MNPSQVDTTKHRDISAKLHAVATEVEHTGAHIEATAEVVGHPLVATALQEFSAEWSYRRTKMVQDIAELSEETAAVGEGFEYLDRELGATLRGSQP